MIEPKRYVGRVLHLGKFYPPFRGGMEVFLADLIEAQREQGLYAIGLVHGHPRDDDPPWLHRVKVQTQVFFAPVGLSFPFALRRLMKQFEPDVLHLHMPNNAVFWALLMRTTRDVPWVVHWHSDVVVSRIRNMVAVAYALYRPFEKAVLRRASAIIVTSPDYQRASAALQPFQDKCHVVPLGIKPAPLLAEKEPSPSEWRPGVLRLLSVGRLTYYKGFGTLIRAVSAMTGVQLLIVGDGAMRAELKALVRTYAGSSTEPTVKLLGAVDEERKHHLLRECDLFCLASRERTEAFGIVLLEAMQHAKPCLVSDLPGSGMPWLVRRAGSGMLVPVDDVAAWRNAIAHLQTHKELRNQFGAAGRRAAEELFSIKACAAHVARIYNETSDDVHTLPADCGALAVLTARNVDSSIDSLVATLHRTGWPQVLVVDRGSDDQTAEAACYSGACVIRTALPLSIWSACQTGLRYGLHRGYRQLLTVHADRMPAQTDLKALAALARQPGVEHDVVIGIQPQSPTDFQPRAWRWFSKITGLRLCHPDSLVCLYTHDAMVVCASRQATLVDHEEIGTLLLLHKSRLRIAGFPLSPVQQRVVKQRRYREWVNVSRYIIATLVMGISTWNMRRRNSVIER